MLALHILFILQVMLSEVGDSEIPLYIATTLVSKQGCCRRSWTKYQISSEYFIAFGHEGLGYKNVISVNIVFEIIFKNLQQIRVI